MTAILPDTDSSSPAVDAHPVPEPSKSSSGSRQDAVAAVSEHCLQSELRRLKALQGRIESEVAPQHDATQVTLQCLLDRGSLMLLAFDAAAPHAVRELGTAQVD